MLQKHYNPKCCNRLSQCEVCCNALQCFLQFSVKMPALNVYQQKAQDQCLGSSGKFGKHQQSLPLMSNSNSDFEVEDSSDASSQASTDSRSSHKEVDHCQGASETGDMLCPSTHGALTYLQNRHSRG